MAHDSPSIQLDPRLVDWINRQGKEALRTVTPLLPGAEVPSQPQFTPDLAPSVTISEDDIEGVVVVETRESNAELDSIILHTKSSSHQIDSVGCDALKTLLAKLEATPAYAEKFGSSSTKTCVLDWIVESVDVSGASLWDFMLEHLPDIEDLEVWVPVPFLSVQRELRLGEVTFRPITRDLVDDWFESFPESIPNEVRPRVRERTQGYSVAVVATSAERRLAIEQATAKARDAVALLRIFSLEIMIANRRSRLEVPATGENTALEAYLKKNGSWTGRVSTSGARPGGHLVIDDERLAQMSEAGFGALQELLDSTEGPSNFQQGLLQSLLIYSRSALDPTPHTKVVSAFTALEQIVGPAQGPSIQQSIAEAIAFVVGKGPKQRIEMVRTVKAAYAVRSKFLHEDRQVEDIDAINAFLGLTWRFFIALLTNHRVLRSRDELRSLVEHRKFS